MGSEQRNEKDICGAGNVVTKTEPYDTQNYDVSGGYDFKLMMRDKKSHNNRHYKYNPKPLGKKNSRKFVAEDKKTEEYWQKRIKNNVAARKSREDRRRKELETLNKQAHYEKENLQLRMLIEKIQAENQYLLYEITLLREEKGCPKF